jgi:hypothetical protein
MSVDLTDLLESKSGGKGGKKIAPGNHVLKITSISTKEDERYPEKKYIYLNVETEPIEDFEGFYIDNDQSKGRHLGKIGKINANPFGYKDGTMPSGEPVTQQRSMFMFVINLCKTLGITEWAKEQNKKHADADSLINAFNASAPFKDVYLEFCVGGQEWINAEGYTNYNLQLPKASNGKYAMASLEEGKCLKFDQATHIYVPKNKTIEVKNFGGDDDFDIPKSSSAFSLD